jgi:hypothetical protein
MVRILQFNQIIETAKFVVECSLVVLGWLFLRRLEQIKLEVARRSDFSQKWAALFFDASNAFMASVERLMTCLVFIVNTKDPNGLEGTEWQRNLNATLPVLVENHYRIQRLAALAPSMGPAAKRAAAALFESIQEFTVSKETNIEELRDKIDKFNFAVRDAHSEMIASRKDSH